MKYRLVITTDGREGLLERALESLDTHVRPRPVETVVVDDSGDPARRDYLEELLSTRMGTYGGSGKYVVHPSRVGFCETVGDAWKLAGETGYCPQCGEYRPDYAISEESGVWEWGLRCPSCDTPTAPLRVPDYVFWLEDDFVFERMLPLVDLAYCLDMEPHVAQMMLLRQPVSDEEVAAGGFLNIAPERFERRGSGAVAWIQHSAFWSTNPSLFARDLPARYPWPTEAASCEGEFTRRLLEERPETTFGIWGTGEPWIRHAGDRVGVGY
jgi:hypothetical protein